MKLSGFELFLHLAFELTCSAIAVYLLIAEVIPGFQQRQWGWAVFTMVLSLWLFLIAGYQGALLYRHLRGE